MRTKPSSQDIRGRVYNADGGGRRFRGQHHDDRGSILAEHRTTRRWPLRGDMVLI